MANRDHIRWILEGVEGWNKRRDTTDFEPDLSGEDIYERFSEASKLGSDGYIPLGGINLKNANLQRARLSSPYETKGADLRNSNLRQANMREVEMGNSRLEGAFLLGTRFDSANLQGSCFRGSKMGSTSFLRANLFDADFTGTKLNLTILSKANLTHATLKGADLSQATLLKTGLQSSMPWTANLFGSSSASASQPVAPDLNCTLSCVEDLIEACRRIRSLDGDLRLYFRGEKSSDWSLRPSVARCATSQAKERTMLLELMSKRPEDFESANAALSQWVVAQHHGLHTRLLDVTRNPLVALFHACEKGKCCGKLHIFSAPRQILKPFTSDTVRILMNFAKLARVDQRIILGHEDWSEGWEHDPQPVSIYKESMNRLYHLIRQEIPSFAKKIDPRDFYRVIVVEPQQKFERLRAQAGAFIISAFHERFEREEILKANAEIPVYGHLIFKVPKNKKQDILEELELLSITRETLFPSLEEAARSVMSAKISS